MHPEPVKDRASDPADDALFLLPARYEDRTQVTAIGALLPGHRVVVEGEVQLAEVVYRRRRALLVRISASMSPLTSWPDFGSSGIWPDT